MHPEPPMPHALPRAPARAVTGAAPPRLLPWLLLAAAGGSAALLLAANGAGAALGWLLAAVGAAALVQRLGVDSLWARLARELEARGAEGERLRRGLDETFRELGAGDLVRGRRRAAGLPPRLEEKVAATTAALSDIAREIQESSLGVAATAERVDQTASDLAAGAGQQAASAVEITAAMEELAETAAQIAAHAGRQAALAERAQADGVEGAAAVEGAAGGVAEVLERIQEIAARTDALGARSREIFRVLDLVTEIAHETHVLSLNTALEATAAGDQGRRFAVVADEVRRLAQRSRDSVGSVRSLLDEFAGSIRATVVATDEGSREAARVLERARSAAAAIGELSDAVSDSARTAGQISRVTQQQTTAAEEVLATLRELNQVVQRMTRDLHRLTDTAGRLRRVGLTLQLLAQSFHLDSPRSLRHLAEGWAARLDPGAGAAALERLLGELVREASFAELAYFVDTDGRTVALALGRAAEADREAIAARLRSTDMRQRPWFRAVAREWRTALVPPYESLPSTSSCFTVGTPVRRPDGAVAGVLGVDVSLTEWTRI
jgi:methyl-accepting chemotaxis protein